MGGSAGREKTQRYAISAIAAVAATNQRTLNEIADC
jgi:hypothetical protein